MELFFKQFHDHLKSAIINDYNQLVKLCDAEDPYVCALVTDSDGTSLYFAMNTQEQIKQKLSKVGHEYAAYYTWTPSEFGYGDHLVDDSWLVKTSEILDEQAQQSKNKANFPLFEQQLHTCMINVLSELVQDHVFSGMVVFISISDDERARTIENLSAKLINQEQAVSQFLQRFSQ